MNHYLKGGALAILFFFLLGAGMSAFSYQKVGDVIIIRTSLGYHLHVNDSNVKFRYATIMKDEDHKP